MGYWGAERLSSDQALDAMWVIEKSLLEQFNEAYEIGTKFAIADVVISNDQLGSLCEDSDSIVKVMISEFINELRNYTYDDTSSQDSMALTIKNTISQLVEKVVKYDLQVAEANAFWTSTQRV